MRTSAVRKSQCWPKPASSPATRQPRTLTANVPAGNFQSRVCCSTSEPSPNRDTDPSAPPMATSRMAFKLKRLPQKLRELADHAAAEREHADHEDDALHHGHPGAELREVV